MLEFFDNYLALHFQALRIEVEAQHAVAFQPEPGLYVLVGEGDVIIGDVVIGPCVVFPSGVLDRRVIVGDIYRTAEHQVFEQMGKACMFGGLVARAYIVQDVERHHLGGIILIVHNAQPVAQCIMVYLYHINEELRMKNEEFSMRAKRFFIGLRRTLFLHSSFFIN